MMPGRLGKVVSASETPVAGSLYASPSGSGNGLTASTPASLTYAIANAATGADVICLPGIYTNNDGAITRTVRVRPQAGLLSNSVSISGQLYPGRASYSTTIFGGYTAQSLLGTAGGGEYWMSIAPSTWTANGSKMGIIFMHGATGNETNALSLWPAGITNIITTLATAGYPILSVYGGGDTWGNAVCMARMDEAKAYLQGTMGAKAGKIGLMGASMGGLSIQNWSKNNLSSVACAVGLVPVSDITDIVTNNRSGLATSVNSAYSTWNESTMGALYNPHTYAPSSLVGLNYKAWYGASDTIVIPSTVTDVITSIGATASGVSVVGNHTSTVTTVGSIPPADVLAFFDAHAS